MRAFRQIEVLRIPLPFVLQDPQRLVERQQLPVQALFEDNSPFQDFGLHARERFAAVRTDRITGSNPGQCDQGCRANNNAYPAHLAQRTTAGHLEAERLGAPVAPGGRFWLITASISAAARPGDAATAA